MLFPVEKRKFTICVRFAPAKCGAGIQGWIKRVFFKDAIKSIKDPKYAAFVIRALSRRIATHNQKHRENVLLLPLH